jgi:hypothetical protein
MNHDIVTQETMQNNGNPLVVVHPFYSYYLTREYGIKLEKVVSTNIGPVVLMDNDETLASRSSIFRERDVFSIKTKDGDSEPLYGWRVLTGFLSQFRQHEINMVGGFYRPLGQVTMGCLGFALEKLIKEGYKVAVVKDITF